MQRKQEDGVDGINKYNADRCFLSSERTVQPMKKFKIFGCGRLDACNYFVIDAYERV